MTDSTGLNAVTGKPLSDWEHTQQSIGKILTTPIGSRIMRRDFGASLPDLIDAKMVQRNVLALYVAAAAALDRWEPRFRLSWCRVGSADATGAIHLELHGTYFPRGHKGDYSVAQDASTSVLFSGGVQ